MRFFSYIFWIFIVLCGVVFVVANSHSVEIDYYLGKEDIYLPLLLLIELAIGALLGLIALMPHLLKLKAELRKAHYQNKRLQKDLQKLKFIKNCVD